ncbi:hypothetical protein AB4Y87_04585 [Paenarthrobacter sp. RAF54_2]|uniref:hypothetical protein n=1 Tax=Paenarthrobacter sp. RAF54_2 TaxID=3233061 RepID=UPI003F96D281
MRTVQISIEVRSSEVAVATSALEETGFTVRLGFDDFSTATETTALILEIAFPLAGADDAEVDQQAFAMRDEALKDAGIEFQHLGSAILGPSLSTFTVRERREPEHGQPWLKIQAQDWEHFEAMWELLGHGEFDGDKYEVSVVGLAAGDPRP